MVLARLPGLAHRRYPTRGSTRGRAAVGNGAGGMYLKPRTSFSTRHRCIELVYSMCHSSYSLPCIGQERISAVSCLGPPTRNGTHHGALTFHLRENGWFRISSVRRRKLVPDSLRFCVRTQETGNPFRHFLVSNVLLHFAEWPMHRSPVTSRTVKATP